jgi:uroporphyrinogen-III synthase
VKVIVTRPREQSRAWIDGLQAHGLEAVALPLIAIGPAADRAPVEAAWFDLPRQAALMFVSANAVEHFFDAAPGGAGWPPGTLAAATGPGTAAALIARGVPPAQLVQPAADAERFDSEHLWPQLAQHDWAGRPVLIVRGEGGRDWLGERWREAGAEVRWLQAYRRAVPALDAGARALLAAALAAPADHVWVFSSSEAIANLGCLVPTGTPWTAHTALATHPRIGDAARAAGFGRVVEAGADLGSVVACLESL